MIRRHPALLAALMLCALPEREPTPEEQRERTLKRLRADLTREGESPEEVARISATLDRADRRGSSRQPPRLSCSAGATLAVDLGSGRREGVDHDALGSDLGAAAAGRPDLAPEVRQICRRESWGCRRIGVHEGHVKRKAVAVFAAAARRTGVAEGCPEVAAREWGPRGPHGHVPAHALRHLPRCSPPWVLDLPVISGYVAARRLEVLERRYNLTTPRARGHAWRHGVSCTCEE